MEGYFQQEEQKEEDYYQEDYEEQKEVGEEEGLDLERQAKQRYLRREIIDKGYQAEEFAQFLAGQKHEGLSIENWSLDELQGLVDEFQEVQEAIKQANESASVTPKETPGQPSESQQTPKQEKQDEWEYLEASPQQVQQAIILEHLHRQSKPHIQRVQVERCLPTMLNETTKPIKVGISKVTPVQTTQFFVFKVTILHFTLFTEPYKWEVKRLEQDFYSIRRLLQLQFPQLIVPPLPKQKEQMFTQKTINKRKLYFQRFLNAVLKTSEFRSYPYLLEFLKINHKSPQKFQEQMVEEEERLTLRYGPVDFATSWFSYSPGPELHHIINADFSKINSLQGEVEVDSSDMAQKFNINKFISDFELLQSHILTKSRQMKESSERLYERYLRLQDKLCMVSQLYSKSDDLTQLELFALISKQVGSDGYFISQNGLLLHKMLKWLKWNMEQVAPMKEQAQKVDLLKEAVFRYEKQLNKEREKKEMEIGVANRKVENVLEKIMPEEWEQLKQRKLVLEFFQGQQLKEVNRHWSQVEYPDFRQNVWCFAQNMSEELNQQHILWAEMIDELDKLSSKSVPPPPKDS